ncbi:hypothetical protein ACOSP7_007676 [Xanthoceras sorbifolium]
MQNISWNSGVLTRFWWREKTRLEVCLHHETWKLVHSGCYLENYEVGFVVYQLRLLLTDQFRSLKLEIYKKIVRRKHNVYLTPTLIEYDFKYFFSFKNLNLV